MIVWTSMQRAVRRDRKPTLPVMVAGNLVDEIREKCPIVTKDEMARAGTEVVMAANGEVVEV